MLVRGGRIVERGAETSTVANRTVDLEGQTLRPAFIDSHCHILPTGLDLLKLNLGDCGSEEAVLSAVRHRHDAEPSENWLRAVLYDQNRFPSGKHLHRDDLDAISSTRPIILRHSNGHASVANTPALIAAGIDESVEDPPGGTYVRDASGRLTGVLLETAHERVFDSGPKVRFEEMVEAILRAGDAMSSVGLCCASDMMTGRYDLETELLAYIEAAKRGCKVRTRLYLQWKSVFGARALSTVRLNELASEMHQETVRIAGIKIFADGAIGSRTAAIYGSYEGDASSTTSGQLIYSPSKLTSMVKEADEAGYQVCVHSIGDHSTDMVMDAFAATGQPSRHRIEHAMILSDPQIDRLAKINCFVTMQPEFLMRFGTSYQRNLGLDRASNLNRASSLINAGLRLSLNSDRPIVQGDPRDGIRMAVHRPAGFNSSENISESAAIHGYTSLAADVNGDRGLLGRLEPGELALFSTSKLELA